MDDVSSHALGFKERLRWDVVAKRTKVSSSDYKFHCHVIILIELQLKKERKVKERKKDISILKGARTGQVRLKMHLGRKR